MKIAVLRGLYKQQTRVLIDLHNNKKSKMNVQEAEGSCPSEKKTMILSWSHIRLNVENVSQLQARMLL